MAFPIAAVGAIAGKLIDAAAGQHRDSVQFQRQKELNKENNEFNAREAAKQRESAAAQMRMQQQYNSEQAQVSRLKQAGLNPALLYGGSTSSAGISSTSAASASPSSYNMSGTQLDVSGALQSAANMDLQRAQTENTRMNTMSQSEDVFSKQVNNKYINTKTNIELLKMLQEYENLKKVGALSDKDLQWYDQTKSSVLDQIRGQIDYWTKQGNLADKESDLAVVNADYVRGAKTENTVADTALKGSEKALNIYKGETEKTVQAVNRENVNSQQVRQALEKMQAAVSEITEKELQRKYNLDNYETQGFYKFCDRFGISRAFAKGLLNIYGKFTEGTGKGLSEFFSGNNWFDFYNKMRARENDKQMNDDRIKSDNYRTDEWKQKPKESNPTSPTNPHSKDVVKPVPRTQIVKEYVDKYSPNWTQQQKELYNNAIANYSKWTPEKQRQFRKDIYYADIKDLTSILLKYQN